MNKEQLLSKYLIRTDKVKEITYNDEQFYIRPMNGKTRKEFIIRSQGENQIQAILDLQDEIILHCLVTKDNENIFNKDERDSIENLDMKFKSFILNEVIAISGINDDVEEKKE